MSEIIDYMAEYRTDAELTLRGIHDDDDIRVEVAKIGGGTLGKAYPAGEQWIVNSYVNDELTESTKNAMYSARTHMEVLQVFASAWFGI